jgi:hypothetical protein
MYNTVLWVLDNEIDPAQFERLCIDLLYRNGLMGVIARHAQSAPESLAHLQKQLTSKPHFLQGGSESLRTGQFSL